ncbi:MAG: SAM-dependent chlorinase/fluorinase [Rhodospirillales bacterium]|nr:SAM-dependent chlorinase/fluorinase [Rhodospirillales bacterium]
MTETKPIRVVTIGDYGRGELASMEVRDRIEAEFDKQELDIKSYAYYSVPAFNTISAGFSLAQLTLATHQPNNKAFFVNVAPRDDNAKPRVNNEGEGFVYVRLYNGVEIFAVNSGHTLTFVKEAAEEIREIKVKREGSQFRSRDIFPEAMARLLAGDKSLLGREIDKASIPDKSTLENVICHIDGYGDGDGYGNLKILIKPDALDQLQGKEVFVTIDDKKGNSRTHKAKVTERIFDVEKGAVAFARAGSSGWAEQKGGLKLTFAEVVVRGGSAYEHFGKPKVGSSIEWKPVV